jgi:hypothetical protein
VTGPGKCDPGKCIFGATTNPTIAICNAKCFIDVKTFKVAGKFAQVKITNSATGEVYVVLITNAQAVFWLDIAKCQPGPPGVFAEDSVTGTGSQINQWASEIPPAGSFVVDMISGSTVYPGATWVGIQFLLGGIATAYFPVYAWDIKSVTFYVTGFQLDNTTMVFSNGVVKYYNETATYFP